MVIDLLSKSGRALNKSDIEDTLNVNGEAANAIRRLQRRNRVSCISLNGSKRYSYIALKEWLENKGREYHLNSKFAPEMEGVEISSDILKVHVKKVHR
jgi:hypothetical protein